jgi:RNA polymerase sigma-70 factor (ECF subfamily)
MTVAHSDHQDKMPSAGLAAAETTLLARLREGDEEAFMMLVIKHQAALIRTALIYVRERTLAEEVVQDTWIAFLQGLNRFEGRSSLKTWLFSILINRAKTQALREAHYVAAGDIASDEVSDEPAVDPARFYPSGHPDAGFWATQPRSWEDFPEERLLSLEVREVVGRAIAQLQPMQRQVITLRDVEGWDAEQVCKLLNISATNQRVLLHRARTVVRQAVEDYLDEQRETLTPAS